MLWEVDASDVVFQLTDTNLFMVTGKLQKQIKQIASN